jgi:hypothetical protein
LHTTNNAIIGQIPLQALRSIGLTRSVMNSTDLHFQLHLLPLPDASDPITITGPALFSSIHFFLDNRKAVDLLYTAKQNFTH